MSISPLIYEPWGSLEDVEPPAMPWPFTGMEEWFAQMYNVPFEAAQDLADTFFGDLASTVDAIVSGIVGPIEDLADWLAGKITDLTNAIVTPIEGFADTLVSTLEEWANKIVTPIENFASALVSEIETRADGLVSAIEGWGNWVLARLIEFADDIVTSIEDGTRSLWDELTRRADQIVSSIEKSGQNLWQNILKKADEIVSWLEEFVSKSFEEHREWILGGINKIQEWLIEFIKMITEAMNQALQGLLEFFMDRLVWMASMVMGAVNAVIKAVRGAFNNLVTGFLSQITSGLSKGSPPKEVETAVDVMVETIWDRQIEIIEEAYSSPANPDGISTSALGVLSGLLVAGIGGMVAGAAADFAHPIKQLQARSIVQKVIDWVGTPAVIASIATMPTAIGLLIPLRYHFNTMFKPMQPGAGSIITMAVRECFIEDRRRQLLVDYPGEDYTNAMAREGFSLFWAQMHWAMHWRLPSVGDLNQMLYRGLIGDEIWLTYAKYHDYEPGMRENLRQIQFNPYTRVDIRRMWDMRIVTEAQVYENYRWLGYDHEHALNMLVWTKVYTAFPDLIARFENGWITAEEVLAELIGYGMPEQRAVLLLQTRIESHQPGRVEKERDLTKSEIVKGVKAELITIEQGIELLMDMGYEEWEAGYILVVNKAVGKGHPDGFYELKQITTTYKKALGKKVIDVPEELIRLEAEMKAKRDELKKAEEEGVDEEKLSEIAAELAGLEYRYRELTTTFRQTGRL